MHTIKSRIWRAGEILALGSVLHFSCVCVCERERKGCLLGVFSVRLLDCPARVVGGLFLSRRRLSFGLAGSWGNRSALQLFLFMGKTTVSFPGGSKSWIFHTETKALRPSDSSKTQHLTPILAWSLLDIRLGFCLSDSLFAFLSGSTIFYYNRGGFVLI